jgi:hypothetical protein
MIGRVSSFRTLLNRDFVLIMAKDLNKKQLTSELETWILGLGHYQQEIFDRESTIMPYIANFGFWTFPKSSHMSKTDNKHYSYWEKRVFF